MSDRTLPGVHDKPGGNRRWALGCLGIVVALVALIGGCTALMTANQQPYDANNEYEAIAQCEDAVKNRLKSPSTAEFDLTATGSGTWIVTGTVDAENSFGAMTRSNVQCTVIVEGDSIRVRVDQLD